MRFHRGVLSGLALAFAGAAMAGSNTATLSCQRPGTPFKLEGTIPATESGLDLRFTDAAGTLEIADHHGADIIDDFRAGVFTMQVSGEHGFTLYALPKTVRAAVRYGETKASFEAIVHGLPRTDRAGKAEYRSAEDVHDRIRMRCRYNYSI